MLDWLRNLLGPGKAVPPPVAPATGQGFLPGPTGGLFSEPVRLAQAGEQLTHYRSWVYASIRPIASRIAGLPIRLARRTRRRTRGQRELQLPAWLKQAGATDLEPIESHPLLDALNDPNEVLVAWQLVYSTVASLQLTGRAYLWLFDGPDGRLQLWPLPPSWVTPQSTTERLFSSYVVRPKWSQESFEIDGDDLCRFCLPDPRDPLGAYAPLQAVGRSVIADEAIQTSQHQSFRNGPHPGMLLQVGRHPDMPGVPGQRPILTRVQRNEIYALVRQFYSGVQNSGEPLILDGLLEDAKPFALNPAEMDYLNSGAATKARITQGFGTNPLIMGEIQGANRAQAVVAEESFLAHTVNPLAVLMSQVLTGWISVRYGPDLILYLEEAKAHDPESERADWQQMIGARCVTRNEVRQHYGLPPLLQGGDELVTPGSAPQPPAQEGQQDQQRLILPTNGRAH